MPSPSFLTKAFIAGFLFGHLFVPAEKSWVFKLVRSPRLSHRNLVKAGNESLQTHGVDQLKHLVADNIPVSVSLLPLPGNLSVTSNLPADPRSVPTRPLGDQHTLSRETSALAPFNSSNPITHSPSATARKTVSTTIRYVYDPSASARPRVSVAMSPRHSSRPGPFQFRLTVLSLLCVSVLLCQVMLLMHRKWRLKRKTRRLPATVVSMVIANLRDDPQSLKACSLVSRSWVNESQRYLFHTISLDSEHSADVWFSKDTLGLVGHVRSIRMSMEAIAGAERGLGRFQRVKTLRVSDWCGPQLSLPVWWSPLKKTVLHLELIQPEGTPQEILAFVSFFASLESLHITTGGRQLSGCEVHAIRAGDPEVVSICLPTLRQPPVSGAGLIPSCSASGISVWLYLDTQEFDEPFTALLGRSNVRITKACRRCFTGRPFAYPLPRLIHLPNKHTPSIIRIDNLPEEMINVTDNLLVSLPSVSPRTTKVVIERFGGVDTILVDKILPKFRRLGGVVEIGEQRICI